MVSHFSFWFLWGCVTFCYFISDSFKHKSAHPALRPKCLEFFLFFSHILHPSLSFSSFFPSRFFLSSPCPIHSFSISLQKRAVNSWISTKGGSSSSSKTRLFPSYEGWTRQPSRRKSPKNNQRVRDSPAPTVRCPSRKPKYTGFTDCQFSLRAPMSPG